MMLRFRNNEADLEISKYYFDIRKYIKSKKAELSDDYQTLMKQNEKTLLPLIKQFMNEASIFLKIQAKN